MDLLDPLNPLSPFSPLNPANPASPLNPINMDQGGGGGSNGGDGTAAAIIGLVILGLFGLFVGIFCLQEWWNSYVMSYNIDSVMYLGSGQLKIKKSVAAQLREELSRDLPELSFIEENELGDDDKDLTVIEQPYWNGESSGYSYHEGIINKVLEKTKGTATLLFTWEGGDSFTALHVKNGVVTNKKVKITARVTEEDEDDDDSSDY